MSIQRLNHDRLEEQKMKALIELLPEQVLEASTILTETGSITTSYGITAHAGGGQLAATQLSSNYNNVTTCATAKDSVKLPEADEGTVVIVRNDGATSCDVFPYLNDSINNLAINLAISLPVGSEVKFTALSSNWWVSDSVAITLNSPSTQKGSLVIKAADNAGETQTTITNASQAAARTYTIPDAGAAAQFVLSTASDGKTAALHENLTIAEGFDVTITAEDAAGSITLDEQTFEVEGEGTASQLTKIVNLANAAATLSISGVTCALNQDLQTTASPTFVGTKVTANIGTVGTSVTAVEWGNGMDHVTVLTITNKAITIGDNENLGIGALIYTLPAGAQLIEGAYMSIGLTATDAANAANTPEVGIGLTQASTAVAVLSTAGWEDIFEGDAMTNCTGTAYVLAKLPTAGVPLLTQVGGTKTIYLNFAAAWSDNTVQTATISGTVTLKWTTLV